MMKSIFDAPEYKEQEFKNLMNYEKSKDNRMRG